MFGSFQLWRDGRSIENLPGTRTPRILRYLAAQRGRPVPREILIDVFWPDADTETGRRNLHQSIYQIRCAARTAGDTSPFIAFEHDSYALDTAAGCWCDFEDLVAEGRSAEREERLDDAVDACRRADALYSGDYLADSPYEEWAIAERERLRVAYRTMANRLADLLVQRDDRDGALVLTQRILTLDPSDEIAHRRAMRCYAATAERSQLVRQYEACTAALGELCGVPPSTATSSLFHSLMERCGNP